MKPPPGSLPVLDAGLLSAGAGSARQQFENTPMAVIECDRAGIVTRWAGEAERLFGWPAADVLGQPLDSLALVHPHDAAVAAAARRRLFEGAAGSVTTSQRNHTRQRRLLHCTWHDAVQTDAAGQPVAVLSLVLDTTSQQRAEEALRASEERHRLLAETMLQGVVHQDSSGRIIAMNPAAVQILGKSRERFLGSDSAQQEHDTVREDGSPFPGDQHPSMQALKTGRPVRGVVMGVWHPQRRQTRWLRIDAVPVFRGTQTQPAEVYAVFEDITEQRQAQEALRLSTQRFQLALQGSRIMVFHQDLALRYTWTYNPAAGAGAAVDSFIGLTDVDVAERRSDAVRTEAIKRKVIASGQALRQEVPMRWGGSEREFDLLVEPMRDHGGHVCGVTSVAIDITERKQAERALRQADRQKDLFLATLAHELRNPLAPILHAATLLRALSPAEATAATRSGAIIERQAAQMARLLDDLLDVSRVASGRLLLRSERLLLGSVVDEAVETARPLIDAAGHALSVVLPGEPVYLQGDRVRLAQVCANLLTNAAKYTPPGGRIDVQAWCEGATVVISVRDNGIGLAPEHRSSVFAMFGQVDTTLERAQGGLGIGLALARGLVDMHGGSIEARSDGLGRGSDFMVRLPLRSGPPRAAAQVPAAAAAASMPASAAGHATAGGAPAAPHAPHGRRILVVDDNRDAADMLALLLTSDGHSVQVAYDATQALARARAGLPDVALLDLGLPGMNGYDLCRALRQLPDGAALRVVAISGWGQQQDRQRSAAAGFDAHLVKPVEHARLQGLLAAPLGARSSAG